MLPYQNLSLEDMPGEEWRDIPGWESYYQISNLGRAKSVERFIVDKNGVVRPIRSRIIRVHPSGPNRAYLGFGSHRDGECGRIYIHKSVAMAFIQNDESKPCVDHINADTFDNRVDNLRWVTQSENLRNPIALQRMSKAKSGEHCNFYRKRLHAKPVRCIHQDGTIEMFPSIYDATKAGYCERSIRCCIKGIYSHHKGCKWEYGPK